MARARRASVSSSPCIILDGAALNALWRPGVGAVILIVFALIVEYTVGWARLLAPWRDVSLAAIVVAMLLTFGSYWLRAARFYDYFRGEMKGRFVLCTKLMLQHNLLNNLLPMRSGELSFPVLMSRYFAVPARRSLPALLWFRVLDLHTLGAAALLALYRVSPLIVIVLLAWLPLPWLLFHFSARTQAWLARHHHGRPARLAAELLQGLPQERPAFFRAWGWTLVNWLVKLAAFAWVLRLFINIDWPAAGMGALAGDLTSVLPIHGIAGAGTYEAGVVAGLLPFGVTATAALAAAVNLHLFLLGTTLAGGAVALCMKGPARG